MKLELDCTWNDKKDRAKQRIRFDYYPKAIFKLPIEKITMIQELAQKAPTEGPSTLKAIEELTRKFPKSLYALLNYYKVLNFFEYLDEASGVFIKMKELFPEEVFIKCIDGEFLLNKKEYKKFTELFNNIEVLKGAFPKRSDFFFEEAIFFHNLWGRYFFETGDGFQAEKHKKLIILIMNTLQNFQIVGAPT